MKKVLIYTLAITSIACHAYACIMHGEEKQRLFKQYDTNKDNTLSEDEYVRHEQELTQKSVAELKQRFAKMDTQKSGQIKLEQFSPINMSKCGGGMKFLTPQEVEAR